MSDRQGVKTFVNINVYFLSALSHCCCFVIVIFIAQKCPEPRGLILTFSYKEYMYIQPDFQHNRRHLILSQDGPRSSFHSVRKTKDTAKDNDRHIENLDSFFVCSQAMAIVSISCFSLFPYFVLVLFVDIHWCEWRYRWSCPGPGPISLQNIGGSGTIYIFYCKMIGNTI
jgi:hypothetical protein